MAVGIVDRLDGEQRQGGQAVGIDDQGLDIYVRHHLTPRCRISRNQLTGEVFQKHPQIDALEIWSLIESPINQRQSGDPLTHITQGRASAGILQRALLQAEQAGNHLQIVFHPVMDFAHQVVLLRQSLAQRGIATQDGVSHVLKRLGQLADFWRHLFGVHRTHTQTTPTVDPGDALKIGDPAHHHAVSNHRHGNQRQQECEQRKGDTGQGIQTRPRQHALGSRREHDIDLVTHQRRGRIDTTLPRRIAPIPDQRSARGDLGLPVSGQFREGTGPCHGDIAAARLHQPDFGTPGQRGITQARLQAGERDHRHHRAVEGPVRTLGARRCQHRRLCGIGSSGIAGDGNLAATGQLKKPRRPGPSRVCRHRPGRTHHPALTIKTYQIEVTWNALDHLTEPLGALKSHGAGCQGLEQHVGALDPRARNRRAPFRRVGEVLAKLPTRLLEADHSLKGPEQQHRQQRSRHRRSQADPDRAQRSPRLFHSTSSRSRDQNARLRVAERYT